MKKAVALLSGGLDSATAVAMARAEGYDVYALTISYGQRHLREVDAARAVGQALGVREHKFVDITLREIGGSALTADVPVPLGRSEAEIGSGIPITYVPARNTIFLSIALGYAEVVGADTLIAGVNQVDYSGYPDCRREYLDAFERLANLATRAGVEGSSHFRIWAPLISMSKAEIIRTGLRLGVDYGLTWSCYSGGDLACGQCDSCQIRQAGFAEASAVDPLR
ncbi:MAG TPA: 7-cyano-7-deazaguanine synthase QueC [Armatimonadota bacterium]|jgi:7-cyano-7-deazaguanine synthase